MSLFASVPSSISAKNQSKIIYSPIIYKNFKEDKKAIWFILEKPYTLKQLKDFMTLLKNKYPDLSYALLSSIVIQSTEKDIKSQVVKFYSENRTKLEDIIPNNSKIITLGRSIYSITQASDIQYTDFVDELTFKNSFYSPDLKSTVYPIYPLDMWLKKDNFERIHCLAQIERCINHVFKKTRVRQPTYFNISDTTKFFNDFKDVKLMALDTETDGFDWRNGRIGDLTIAFNKYEGYHMFWKDIDVKELSNFLKNKKIIMMNGKFDSKFLIRKGVDRDSIYIIDIWNMSHVWKEDNSSESLKANAWRLTNYGGYDRELDRYKKLHKVKSYIDDIPDSTRIPYAIMDAIVTYAIYEELLQVFDYVDKKYPLDNGWSILRYFEEIVTHAVNTFLDVELNGMDINYEELKVLSVQLRGEIIEIENELYSLFNTDRQHLNLYSTDQLGAWIEKLGWKIEDKGKKGIPLTNDECLQRWKKQGHKEAEVLLKLREKDALMKTFIGEEKDKSGFFQYIVKEGNSYKIYPTILPMLADSGRSRHKAPNTANIPSHGSNAGFVKRMFQPPNEDYIFLSADAAGLQLRLGAVASNDEVMRDIFINKGGDLHSKTAGAVFGSILSYKETNGKVDIVKGKKEGYSSLGFDEFAKFRKINDMAKDYRFKSKAVNFGCEFGAMPNIIKTQSIDPEWTIEACKDYIKYNNLEDSVQKHYKSMLSSYDINDAKFHSKTLTIAEDIRTKFFETYVGLDNWIVDTRVLAKKQGFIQSTYGAIRRLPYLLYQGQDTDLKLVSNLLNICLNTSIQNHESVMMNRMMTNTLKFIKDNNFKSYFFGQIHDAAEMCIYKPELKQVYNFMKNEFEKDQPEYNGIPFELEASISDYFGTYKTDNWELWDIGKEIEGYIE